MATRAITRYRTRYVSRPRHRSKRAFTIPLGLVAGFTPLIYYTIRDGRYNPAHIPIDLVWRLTGFNMDRVAWDSGGLRQGLYPLLGGMALHWVANKAGINRALGRARIPLLRI